MEVRQIVKANQSFPLLQHLGIAHNKRTHTKPTRNQLYQTKERGLWLAVSVIVIKMTSCNVLMQKFKRGSHKISDSIIENFKAA